MAPKNLKDLIQKCLSKNPKDRPTFSMVYKKIKNHEILFPDTNEEELEKFIVEIEKID